MTTETTAHRAPSDLTCRRVDSPEAWIELQPHWNRLLELSQDATPWQSYEHLTCWWRYQSAGRALRIYVVERQHEPILIVPLQLTSAVNSGLRVRWLEPIGMLDDINRPRLALGSDDPEMYDIALSAIWNDRREWDGLRLDERPIAGTDSQALSRFARQHRLLFREFPFHPCPYLHLDRTWQEYQDSLGTRLLKNLRAARRKLEKRGNVSLQIYQDPADLGSAFDVFVKIQERSWKHEQGVGLSQSDTYRNYYRDFLRAMAQHNQARILVLYCGEQPVAATIAVMSRGTYYSAQIAHDESFAEASPGTLLESMEFEDLFVNRSFAHYDFFGAALNNKMRWTGAARDTCRLILMQRSVKLRILDAYWLHGKPAIKRLKAALHSQPVEEAPKPGDGLPF